MKVGVIGSGAMGSGIAQVASTAGCKVFLYDTSTEAMEKSKTSLQKIMDRLVQKERITKEEADRIQSNIHYIYAISDCRYCDLVIEAIVENSDIKKKVFRELEEHVSPECIIASNTSSLSITSLAAALSKPQRFLGIHFFNPAPLMKLVEIIPAIQSDNHIVAEIKETITSWGKVTVLAKDTPGFIVNKVARPFYSEALRMYDEGIADFATIDWAMTELGGFRMGPFTLMDFIGNDVNYVVTETVFKSFYYDPRYKPSITQKRLSEAGYHGRKTGKGYYDYTEVNYKPNPVKDVSLGQYIVNRIVAMLINEAADTLHFKIASREDIDTAMTKGVNYPKGLFKWADDIGIAYCVDQMDNLYAEYHEDRYRCSPMLRQMASNNIAFYNETVKHV